MRNAWMICLMLLACVVQVRAAEISVELSGDTAAEGHGVIFTLKVEGGRPATPPAAPMVKDLIMKLRSQGQQTQIVNGRVSRAVVYSYIIGSNKAGEYMIPPIKVNVGGEELETEAFSFTVTPAEGEGAPAGMEDGEAEAPDDDKYGFLQFELLTQNRAHVYPGEIAPVRVKAYFPAGAGVSLSSAPRPEGSAFTLHNLSKQPKQSMEVVDGKRYLVVTWYGGLSATKAGSYPASFSIEGTVSVRDKSARRRPSPFDDPFFGGAFPDDVFSPVMPKEVTLQTEEVEDVEVKELPTEGRPEGFSGAIGQFEFQSVRMPQVLQTGEPAQVTVRLDGKGNFALLKEPTPQPADEWKVYEGKDQFVPGDLASFSGSKTFQYSVVPKVPGKRDVQLGFSYFDPASGEYMSVLSDAQSLEVSGEIVEDIEEVVPVAEEPDEVELAPLRTSLGSVLSFMPLSDDPWYVPTLVGCGVLAMGVVGLGLGKRRYADPVRAALREQELSIKRALEMAGDAARAGDVEKFFVAAREALRLRVSERGGMRAEAVTLADMVGIDAPGLEGLLSEADRIDYSGRAVIGEDLAEWNEKLRQGMEKLSEEGGQGVA